MKYSVPHPPSAWNINSFACHFFTAKQFACRYRTSLFVYSYYSTGIHIFYIVPHTKQPQFEHVHTTYAICKPTNLFYSQMIKYERSARVPRVFFAANPSSKWNTKNSHSSRMKNFFSTHSRTLYIDELPLDGISLTTTSILKKKASVKRPNSFHIRF